MARTRELKVQITGDARSAMRALGSLDSTTRTTGSRIGSAFKAMGKFALLGVGALAVGVVAFGKAALDAAQEAASVGAQTDAVLKSTGHAAGVTAQEVDKLSTSIMGYAAIEDEAIKSGQNLLLTFMNIRNEAGKGNDIFTQSTKLMVDMSVAMGQDLKSSAIQMGKALNDPIKGLTSLSRVGVAFSDQQKKMITRMVEAGNVMGAQKIILAELRKEFGGSARAVGNTKPWERFKLAVGEVVESIGTALLPTINQLARRLIRFVQSDEFQRWLQQASRWLKNNLPDAISATMGFLQKMAGVVRFVANRIEDLVGVIKVLIQWIKNVGKAIAHVGGPILRGFAAAFGFVANRVRDFIVVIRLLIGAISDAVGAINNLLSKAGSIGSKVGGALRSIGGSLLPGFASGVTNFRGGLARVGERGEEIVRLPRGSDVIPNGRLHASGAGGGGDGVTVVIESGANIYGYDEFEDRVMRALDRAVAQR